jgi:hypothetical protein
MGQRGVVQCIGKRAEHIEIYVFDDALVVTPPRAFRAGMAFGLVGGVASALNERRKTNKRKEAVGALGDDADAEQAAAAIDGAELVPLASVTEVRIEKGLGLGRKLFVVRDDGSEKMYRYGEKQQPTADVEAVLAPVLGGRFSNRIDEART